VTEDPAASEGAGIDVGSCLFDEIGKISTTTICCLRTIRPSINEHFGLDNREPRQDTVPTAANDRRVA
jgi:hypothetical protein